MGIEELCLSRLEPPLISDWSGGWREHFVGRAPCLILPELNALRVSGGHDARSNL